MRSVWISCWGQEYCISTQLLHLSQDNHTAADYAVKFRTLQAQSCWNDISLKAVFQQRLSPKLQIELACKVDNFLFSQYVNLAIHVDNLMRPTYQHISARGVQQSHLTPAFNVSISDEPMQHATSLGFLRKRERDVVSSACTFTAARQDNAAQDVQTRAKLPLG